MDKNKIIEIMQNTKNDVNFVNEVSNELVLEKTKELDNLMKAIQADVVNTPGVGDPIIEDYLLQLTNAVYFISTRVESFGFFDDISKANARLKYNQAYAENQVNHATDAKKPTQSDNQLYAEMASIEENAVNIIYSRSLRIVKAKLDSASEMIRTLSKILSAHMNNYSSSKFNN